MYVYIYSRLDLLVDIVEREQFLIVSSGELMLPRGRIPSFMELPTLMYPYAHTFLRLN